MPTKSCKLRGVTITRIANTLIILFVLWCAGALFIIYSQHIETQIHHRSRMMLAVNHIQNDQIKKNHYSIIKEEIILPPTCGNTSNTFVLRYGQYLNPPIIPWSKKPVTTAYGCSMNKKYCLGEPKPIPCCTKIMFDIWHKLDKYLTKYDVEYSLRWGSLLFAVRNGQHMPWDARDIDIGFMRPKNKAKKAIDEFVNEWGLLNNGYRHLINIGSFYELHHQQYGYPDSNEKYCFVNREFNMDFEEYKYSDTLQVGLCFIDIGFGRDGAGGIDVDLSHGMPMIPVSYDGSNGIKAPRQMYVYPDYYKHLNVEYGKWKWFDVTPNYISDFQIQYHGLSKENMTKYWEETKRKTIKALGDSPDAQMFI